jgi:hypothetical protein
VHHTVIVVRQPFVGLVMGPSPEIQLSS